MRDQNFTSRESGPTSAGTTYSTALDTRSPDGVGNLTGKVQIFVDNNTVTGLSDGKNVTLTLQHSDDNSTFADVSGVATIVITGAGGAGGTAAENYRDWTPSLKRYIRFKEVVDGTPGTISAWTYDFGLELGRPAGV